MPLLRKIAWFEPFWVLLVGVLLLVPARFLPPAMWPQVQTARPWLIAALLLFWPVRRLAYGRLSAPSPLNLPLAVLIAWLPVNLWASADKTLSWEALGYLAFALALFFAVINWPPFLAAPQRLAWLLALGGAGMLVAAPLLSRLLIPVLPGSGPFDALMQRLADLTPGEVNLNRTAGALALFLPFYLALALRRDWTRRFWPPLLFLLLAGATATVLALTQSRGAALAGSVGAFAVIFLRWPRLRPATPLLILLAPLALAGVDAIGPAAPAAAAGAISMGWDGRLELWSRALYILADFPFTGAGIGTFDRVVPILYPLFLSTPGSPVSHAHNLILQVGVDLGLPGLIAWLAVLVNSFLLLAGVLRQRQDALPWALAAGVAGSLGVMLVHGLVDAALWGSKPAFLPWLFVALAVVVSLPPSLRPARPSA